MPPSVPIILNVHFPHNTPKLHRCLELGRALARAIKSFNGFGRVALMASGGLSHFVLDEEFDRTVMAAMKTGDEDALAKLPENVFKVGTAEIKNWYPVIAAMNAAGLTLPRGRLRAVLSLGSRHRQRDVLRVLAMSHWPRRLRSLCGSHSTVDNRVSREHRAEQLFELGHGVLWLIS